MKFLLAFVAAIVLAVSAQACNQVQVIQQVQLASAYAFVELPVQPVILAQAVSYYPVAVQQFQQVYQRQVIQKKQIVRQERIVQKEVVNVKQVKEVVKVKQIQRISSVRRARSGW